MLNNTPTAVTLTLGLVQKNPESKNSIKFTNTGTSNNQQ